jgi:hypothetical protein
MKRYFVEIKQEASVTGFYIYAYSRNQIREMLGREYDLITVDQTE